MTLERAMRLQISVDDPSPADDAEVEPKRVPGRRTLAEARDHDDPWALSALRIPGRQTRASLLAHVAADAPAIQRKAIAGPRAEGSEARAVAAAAIRAGGGALPFLDTLQRAFGRHDLRRVRAHVGGDAEAAGARLGARAFAVGEDVVFAGAPDLHTAAHEAAHVVQQRAGVQLRDGVGEDGDGYERHADAIADAVVAGRSVEAMLGDGGDAPRAVQVQLRKIPATERVPLVIAGDEDEIRDGNGYIARLQRVLKVPVTCVYDSATVDAVCAFQRSHDLEPDGFLEATTWRALFTAYRGGGQAVVPARKQGAQQRERVRLVVDSLNPRASAALARSFAMLDEERQQAMFAAITAIDLRLLATVLGHMNDAPQAFEALFRSALIEVGRPLALEGPRAPETPRIGSAGPGGIEHIHNSCYAASILTLIAAVPAYVRLFDARQNPRPDAAATQLQDAMSPLILAVLQGGAVSGAEMADLLHVLDSLGLLLREARDPGEVPTTALPHDAGEVFIRMLAPLIGADNRATYATQRHTERAYDDGQHFTPPDEHLNVISVTPAPNERLEDALARQFAPARSPEGANAPYTDTHEARHLPDVLTIYVTGRTHDHHRLDAPQEMTIPPGLLVGEGARPRYRLKAFILRNNQTRRGGHYVAYASNDEGTWFQADDMGGGAPPEPVVMHGPQPEAPKSEAPRSEAPKSEAPKSEAPMKDGAAKPEAPDRATVVEDRGHDVDATVEALPLVERVELGTATYQDRRSPAFAMGSVYTYERIVGAAEEDDERLAAEEDDERLAAEEDDERLAAGNLAAYPEVLAPLVYESSRWAKKRDSFDSLQDHLQFVVAQLTSAKLLERFAGEVKALENDIALLGLGVEVPPDEIEALHARLASLMEAGKRAYFTSGLRNRAAESDRARFEISTERLIVLVEHAQLRDDLTRFLRLVMPYNRCVVDSSVGVGALIDQFKEVFRQIMALKPFANLPLWIASIDDVAVRQNAIETLYAFFTVDLRNVRRELALWSHAQGTDEDAPPMRVLAPGGRPELHAQVVEELGPASNTTNSKVHAPLPYADYRDDAFVNVGVAPTDRAKLLDLSRDGGKFVEDVKTGKPRLEAPNDKSVREGLTGIAAAKQHPKQFGNVLRGPKAIEFFDNGGKPWDVKTPPSATRDAGTIGSTVDSIGKQLTKSHATYNAKTEKFGAAAPVSVMLDVTYLDNWDWLELWLQLAALEHDRLVRVHEVVVPYPPREMPTGTRDDAVVGTPEQAPDKAQGKTQGKAHGKAKQAPTKKPVKALAKTRGGKPSKEEPEPQPQPEKPRDMMGKGKVNEIYPNVATLEGHRTGALAGAGTSGLAIPWVSEDCLDPDDLLRVMTDVYFENTNGTFSNHRGYLPEGGVLIEYFVSNSSFTAKAEVRLVLIPGHGEAAPQLYITGTHYEPWFELWPGFVWRNGFYRVQLSPQTIALATQAKATKRPAKASTKDGASDGTKDGASDGAKDNAKDGASDGTKDGAKGDGAKK